MTQTEPGWYPDPHGVGVVRWYDGTAWTEHTAALTIPAAIHHPVTPGWFALTRVLQLTLAAIAAIDVWAILDNLRAAEVIGGWLTDPASLTVAEAEDLDRRAMVLNATSLVALLVCGVLFITWLFRVHRSTDLDRTFMEHKSGWAIGGWFVPFLNLWRPLQMVLDVFRGASGSVTLSWVAVAWWVTLLTARVLDGAASALTPAASEFRWYAEEAIGQANMLVIAAAADIVAALVTIVMLQLAANAVRRRLASK